MAPSPLKSSMLPCFGHILRRHFDLLQVKSLADGPLQILKEALRDEAAQRTAACEVLATVFLELEAAAQEAPSSEGNWEVEVAKASRTPAASEAVQRLATLQPELCSVLRDSVAPPAASNAAISALQVLTSMACLGVLHPASLVPDLLASSMSNPSACLRGLAGKLLLKVCKNSPQVLMPVGPALRQAAHNHSVASKHAGVSFGSIASSGQWFAAICQVYTDALDSKKMRGKFLRAVIDELVGLTGMSGDGKDPGLLPDLWSCELLVGLIYHLPLQSEAELGDVLRMASRCLTLRVLPLLQDAHCEDHFERDLETRLDDDHAGADPTTPNFYAAAILMSRLVDHMSDAAGNAAMDRIWAAEAPRLRRDEVLEDRPLAASFVRRSPPDFVGPILKLVSAASSRSDLLDLMVQEIPMDCRAFCGGPSTEGAAKSKRAPGKGCKSPGAQLHAAGGHGNRTVVRRTVLSGYFGCTVKSQAWAA